MHCCQRRHLWGAGGVYGPTKDLRVLIFPCTFETVLLLQEQYVM